MRENKAPEEATVRVLPNCTGKVLGSKTGEVVNRVLVSQLSLQRGSLQLHKQS
jgi:hypothetical protein